MSELREAMEQYLDLRRKLGSKLCGADGILRSFLAFAKSEEASYITTDLALRWARQPAHIQPATWASRLRVVRRFAVWQSATDPRTEVPPEGLLPYRYDRKRPYLFSDEEIGRIIHAARALPSPTTLKGYAYSTIFGLLAVTGMRVSEALALNREDVIVNEGILRIHRSKFGKSRLVPLHASTSEALRHYAKERDRLFPCPATPAFFLSERGTRVTGWATRYNFAKVSRRIGLRPPVVEGRRHGHGPRLHDMRHRFAARTLVEWYRTGADVEREIPKLATYLGHVHVNETYWYIEAVPELLELAARRLAERHKEVGP